MNWEEEILEYRSYLALARKLLKNSVTAYLSDIEEFYQYLTEYHHEVLSTEVSFQTIQQYFIDLNRDGLSAASQSRKISALRSFFTYLSIYDKIEKSPMDKIESPKLSRKIPDTITIEELKNIFIVASRYDSWIGIRNFAIIDTLYSTGIRVSELVNLKVTDLFFDDGFIRIIGKGDKERLVPINEDTIKKIEQYRSNIDATKTDFLFINNRKGQLTREMIFTIIKKIALEAGIARRISPHTFRHTFATHLITAGVDIRLIQEILGHESIITTEIYTHLDTSFKREVVESKHPLSIKARNR